MLYNTCYLSASLCLSYWFVFTLLACLAFFWNKFFFSGFWVQKAGFEEPENSAIVQFRIWSYDYSWVEVHRFTKRMERRRLL